MNLAKQIRRTMISQQKCDLLILILLVIIECLMIADTFADKSADVIFLFPEYDYKETSKNV